MRRSLERLFDMEEAEGRGWLPLSPAPQIPAENGSFASLRAISLEDSDHFLHNPDAGVASLRLLIGSAKLVIAFNKNY
jgi:hypothetical protein